MKDSAMSPLSGNAEGMSLGQIQNYQSLSDTMGNASNRNKWWNVSKLCLTARKEMGDISLTGVG
jgi:hypothetical protein